MATSEVSTKMQRAGWAENAVNQGDGLDLLSALPDNVVATAFYDPQYRGVLDHLKMGNEGARQRGRSTLTQMTDETISSFINEIDRVLRPQGHLFLWVDKFHLCQGISQWMERCSLLRVDMLTWNKGRFGMGRRTRCQSEYLMILQKPPKRAKDVWTIHNIPDVIEEKVGRAGHPHSKPVGIQTRLIEATTRPGDIVLDPAAGSFSVLASCRLAGGRTFWGADLDIANARLAHEGEAAQK